ncbi:MAG: hypothetical protein U5K74_02065 [Gemmatimonadaceae bacterium]|nr:hypothetical protein [Gemmatimonadaceae bacterium]
MTDGEERDVERHVLQPVQEEDDAEQEQQVIVSRDHVLRAEIRKRREQHAAALLDEALVTRCDTVRQRLRWTRTSTAGSPANIASGAARYFMPKVREAHFDE